jgi:enoyl-CoA hydratase
MATQTGAVKLEIQDGLARIFFDDGKANAINGPWLSALNDALDRAAAADAPILLQGRPGFFSGGLDLKTLPVLPMEELRQVLAQFTEVMLRLFTYPRPMVAALTGHAVAGGMVTALGADERILAEGTFRLGLTETAIGLTLPRFVVEMARSQVPVASLRRVVAQGESFDPPGALRIGLVDALVAPEAVVERGLERLRALSRLPAQPYRDNKLVLREDYVRLGRAAWPGELTAFMGFFRRP